MTASLDPASMTDRFLREALDAAERGPDAPLDATPGELGRRSFLKLAGLAGGSTFLDYSVLPLPVTPVRARYWGILFIETGVAIAVAATIVLLFCRLADSRP